MRLSLSIIVIHAFKHANGGRRAIKPSGDDYLRGTITVRHVWAEDQPVRTTEGDGQMAQITRLPLDCLPESGPCRDAVN